VITVKFRVLWLALALPASACLAQENATGILLLAHGGAQGWNEEVNALAAKVNQSVPVEVAFGMASKQTMQEGVDRLVKRGVRRIVAVPLFVSSHSSVITSTQYLLGKRADAPPELAMYARMPHDHGSHAAGTDASEMPAFDPLTPVTSPVPIQMASALDANPVVAGILISRAQAVSTDPTHETVIVVAHGPVSDEENAAWLRDMGKIAGRMRAAGRFARIEYLTVRDDAPDPVRSQATAELRAAVERAIQRDDEWFRVRGRSQKCFDRLSA